MKCGNSWYNANLAWLGTSGDIMSVSDGSIRWWTRAGQPVGKLLNNEGGVVNKIAVSPDGLIVVGECEDDRVRLWNIKQGSLVGQPWEGNHDGLVCLDWSPNGVEVAGGFEDGTIRRWNPATGQQIAPLIKGSDKPVWTIKYSPQGDEFASGGNDKMIRVWSKDGELLIEVEGHDSWVISLCWSKDGAHIFSGSYDHTIRKWQSIDGEQLAFFHGHTQPVTSICLSPDGCHLVSASYDYLVRIWDLETNQEVGDPLWHDNHVSAMALSSDGQYLASATVGPSAKVYVWNLEAVLKRARGICVRVYILESLSFLNCFVHRSGRCRTQCKAQGESFCFSATPLLTSLSGP
jgi:WD40 repeat protein